MVKLKTRTENATTKVNKRSRIRLERATHCLKYNRWGVKKRTSPAYIFHSPSLFQLAPLPPVVSSAPKGGQQNLYAKPKAPRRQHLGRYGDKRHGRNLKCGLRASSSNRRLDKFNVKICEF